MPTFRNTLSVPSSKAGAFEDGTDRVFRNVGTYKSDAGESPKRKQTTFWTRRKLEINKRFLFVALHSQQQGTWKVRGNFFPPKMQEPLYFTFNGRLGVSVSRAKQNCLVRPSCMSYATYRRTYSKDLTLTLNVYKKQHTVSVNITIPSPPIEIHLLLFVFLALQPIVVVFSQPGSGL